MSAAPSRHHPCRSRAGAPRRGFTLVEIVVAMGLLLIGMSSLLALFSFGAGLTRTAQLRTAGAASVEAVVQDLEETLFPLVQVEGAIGPVAGEPREIIDRELPGSPGVLYTAVATPNPAEAGRPGGPLEYKVEVEMRWRVGGQDRKRSFETLLLREVPFGERMRRLFVEKVEIPTATEAQTITTESETEE